MSFPKRWTEVADWLQRIEHPDNIVEQLHESDLCGRYPMKSLELLDAVIDDQMWVPLKFGTMCDSNH